MAEITLLVRFDIEPGGLETFQAISRRAIASTRDEPGTLRYQWFLSADGTHDLNVETFKDSAALLEHLDRVSEVLTDLLAVASVARLEILGEVNEEARKALEDFSTGHYGLLGGFSR